MRIAETDGTLQIFVPLKIRQRVLYLSHYTPLAGHPGITKQFYTMRQTFYWPGMVADIRKTLQNCHACVQERIKLRTHSAPMKLFPARRPLEFVAIDILGPLEKDATDGSRYILVITDRFSKLTKAIPLRKIGALQVAQAFLVHWCFNYGFPAVLLSDNGSQFTAALFKTVCTELGIKQVFTTTYHPQTNGQAEKFNRTILAGIRAFRAENPRRWPQLIHMLTYAYNTQIHSSTGVAPFQLVLSRLPGSVVIRQEPELEDGERRPKKFAQEFIKAVRELSDNAAIKLRQAQDRYKKNFDKKVRPLQHAYAGDWVYLSREQPTQSSPGDKPSSNKLSPKAIGPYEVLTSDDHTVTILREDDFIERVSRNRTVKAPPPNAPRILTRNEDEQTDSTPHTEAEKIDKPGEEAVRTPRESTSDAEFHVVDKIIKYLPKEDLFVIRWHGYGPEGDTKEPPGHLKVEHNRPILQDSKTQNPTTPVPIPNRTKKACENAQEVVTFA